MSRRNRIRRQWTHRRLGLGAPVAADVELARTEALLTAVGARRTTSGIASDSFEAALLDFVCDIDLVADVAAVDAAPIPIAALRAPAAPRIPRRRLTWRVLVPTLTTGLAAAVTAVTLLLTGGTTPTNPAMSATAESQLLLSHADRLLTAAQSATARERSTLVTEAKADLSHVSQLLPLAPATDRPGLRAQLQQLDNRARPLTSPSPSSTGAGSNQSPGDRPGRGIESSDGGSARGGSAPPESGSGSGATTTPVRRPPTRQPPESGSGTGTQPGSPSGATSGATSGQQTGTGTQQPPPRQSSGGTRPPSGTTTYSGTTQQPQPGGGLPPRR